MVYFSISDFIFSQLTFDNKNKIVIENFTFNNIAYNVKVQICLEDLSFEIQHIPSNIETFDNYDSLSKEINKQIDNCISNDNKINGEFYFCIRLNCFEQGCWYLSTNIIYNKLEEKKVLNNNNDNSDNEPYISIDDKMFDDKFEWDLKEWIIRLIGENEDLKNDIEKLRIENKKLISENNKHEKKLK